MKSKLIVPLILLLVLTVFPKLAHAKDHSCDHGRHHRGFRGFLFALLDSPRPVYSVSYYSTPGYTYQPAYTPSRYSEYAPSYGEYSSSYGPYQNVRSSAQFDAPRYQGDYGYRQPSQASYYANDYQYVERPSRRQYPVAIRTHRRGFVESPYSGRVLEVRNVSKGALVRDPSARGKLFVNP